MKLTKLVMMIVVKLKNIKNLELIKVDNFIRI